MHARAIDEHITWGLAIDASTFLPDIPADYQQIDPLGSVKQTAWIGMVPCGLLGYGYWRKRKKRIVKTSD